MFWDPILADALIVFYMGELEIGVYSTGCDHFLPSRRYPSSLKFIVPLNNRYVFSRGSTMNRLIQLGLVLCAFMTVATTARPAAADDPSSCGGCHHGYYSAFYSRRFLDKQPPYFSQFPPVYYSSTIIPRPFGWSPFALRPTDFDQIPRVAPEPKTVENPHVEEQRGGALKRNDRTKTASTPRMIYNPYVVSNPAPPQLVQTEAEN